MLGLAKPLKEKMKGKGKGRRIKDEKFILHVSDFIVDSFTFIQNIYDFQRRHLVKFVRFLEALSNGIDLRTDSN